MIVASYLSRTIITNDFGMWDAWELSNDQVQYTTLNAYLSFQLGLQLVASLSFQERGSFHWGFFTGDKQILTVSNLVTSDSELDYV